LLGTRTFGSEKKIKKNFLESKFTMTYGRTKDPFLAWKVGVGENCEIGFFLRFWGVLESGD
jgi:hypothetical protein